MKILVAGTADLSRPVKRTFLGRSGCEVLTCTRGSEALTLAEAKRPDVIVIGDVGEQPDAFECWRGLKAAEATAALPVLLLVPNGSHTAAPEGAEVFDAHDPRRLMERLAELLDVQRRCSPRRPLKLRVDVYGPAGHGVAHTRDLSTSGLYLKGDLGLAPGDSVQLIFGLPLPGRPTVRAAGEVVRRQAPGDATSAESGVGIRFRKVGHRDRGSIASLVDAAS